MQWQNLNRKYGLLDRLQQSAKTTHGRILLVGAAIGLCYFPIWLFSLIKITLEGSDRIFVNLGFLGFGLFRLWQQRHQLTKFTPTEEEKLVGYLLILGGAAAFLLCYSDNLLQAVSCMLVFGGMAYSWGGGDFFKHHFLAVTLLILSLFPDYRVISIGLWQMFIPPYALENFMAWLGSLALKAMGYQAVAEGRFLKVPGGAVEVAYGCNGFSMAVRIAIASFILGLFMKQTWVTITRWVVVGVILAFVFNVPRIVMLTFASVYWGKASFEFWHGPWGGQIFSAVLMTVYYYVIMGSLNNKPKPSR
jgi:exosortase